jgi:4,5-DOPA dioxygenase extradiol
LNEFGYVFDWPWKPEKMERHIIDHNHVPLIEFKRQGSAFDLAIPTAEHYFQLLYALAIKVMCNQQTYSTIRLLLEH